MTAMPKQLVPGNLESAKDYFQGAMIDEQGRETPITRDMIQRACQRLEESREHQDLRYTVEKAQRRQSYS